MYLVDYHMHSKYSFDGECEIRDICEVALGRGLSEIAITDHMDIYSGKPYEYILDCKNLYKELREVKEEYAGRLKVLVGVEYGQPQANREEALKFINDYPLDFIIGSIHNLWDDKDAYDYDYRETDYHVVYDGYVDWLMTLAECYEYDVLGHVSYPSRYVYSQTGVRVDLRQYEEQYRAIFKKVIEDGRGIELNLSGIARGLNETMPDMYLLKLYRELGGEIITVGSDAHTLDHVGIVTKAGYEILKEAGFKYFTVYDNRKPDFIRIK